MKLAFAFCFLAQLLTGAPAVPPVPITSLAFSPYGAALVSNGPRRLDVRSPKDAALVSQIPCDLPKITGLAFAPRGHLLAVAGGEPGVRGEARLLDWPGGTLRQRFTNSQDVATSVAFNSDGSLFGVAGADHVARVWKIGKTNSLYVEAFKLSGHAGPVLSIAFSPSGSVIVTASADRSIKVWSTEDGRLLRSFSHHLEAVNGLAFRPSAGAGTQPTCASVSDDRTVRIWQPELGRMVRIIRQHRGPVFAVAYAADGKTLYTAGKEGIVRQFDAESDALISEQPAQADWIFSLAMSLDGKELASGDWSGQVRVGNLFPDKQKTQ